VRIPELILPFVAKGIIRGSQILTFWHDTFLYVFPTGARVTVTYKPRERYLYLIFGVTMGRPRDYDTGDILTTDDYGFWHRHSQMRWHWDPAVESIYEIEYPHFLEVTRDDPMELYFYNDTGLTVIQDFSVWMFECAEEHWPMVQRYLRGWFNYFYERGKEVRR